MRRFKNGAVIHAAPSNRSTDEGVLISLTSTSGAVAPLELIKTSKFGVTVIPTRDAEKEICSRFSGEARTSLSLGIEVNSW